MSTTTVPATTNGNGSKQNLPVKPIDNLRDLLIKSKAQIAMALPKHLTPDRLIRVAITACQRVPKLLECSPISIVGCVMQAAELGLELTGPLGQAYMVPYFNKNTGQNEAQFQVGYRGLVELAHRSGRVDSFPARVVCENDLFEFAYGTKPFVKHIPTMDEPGKVVAVYAVLVLKDGGTDFEVMSAAQINAHRARYSKARGGSPWDTAWEEMAKKTVIRRLAKRAPVSVELTTAAVLDEYAEASVPQQLGAGVDLLGSPEPMTKTDELAAKLGTRSQPVKPPEPTADQPKTAPAENQVSDEPKQEDAPETESSAGQQQEEPGAMMDLLDEIDGRIEDAKTKAELQVVGTLLKENETALGADYAPRLARYQAKFNSLAAAEALADGGKKGKKAGLYT